MKELAAALVKAQKEMPAVERDAVNPHFRSSFTTLGHLIAKTKPVLTKHGLTIVQTPDASEGSMALRTVIFHESGEFFNCGSVPLIGASDMQKLGSALTYARRYAWAAALGISDESDDDGNAASSSSGEPQAGSAANEGQKARGTSVSQEPRGEPASPDGVFTFKGGKHAGKTLAETPADYLDWYLAGGPRDDIKEEIRKFRGEATLV